MCARGRFSLGIFKVSVKGIEIEFCTISRFILKQLHGDGSSASASDSDNLSFH